MRLLKPIVALLPFCSSVRLSVWDGRTLWSYVHVSVDLSLWLDSPMFCAPRNQSMSTSSLPLFQFHLEQMCGMDVQTRRDVKNG